MSGTTTGRAVTSGTTGSATSSRRCPRLMRVFAHPPQPPTPFSYTRADPDYAVYGWRVHIARPAMEFSELRAAGPRGFTLRGSGVGRVTTAALFRPAIDGPRDVDLGHRHGHTVADRRPRRPGHDRESRSARATPTSSTRLRRRPTPGSPRLTHAPGAGAPGRGRVVRVHDARCTGRTTRGAVRTDRTISQAGGGGPGTAPNWCVMPAWWVDLSADVDRRRGDCLAAGGRRVPAAAENRGLSAERCFQAAGDGGIDACRGVPLPPEIDAPPSPEAVFSSPPEIDVSGPDAVSLAPPNRRRRPTPRRTRRPRPSPRWTRC